MEIRPAITKLNEEYIAITLLFAHHEIDALHVIKTMLYGFPSPMHGDLWSCFWRRWPQVMDGSREFIELSV